MVALSGGDMRPIVYIGNEECADVVSVRAKTAELRNLLDEADEMADRVFADHEAARDDGPPAVRNSCKRRGTDMATCGCTLLRPTWNVKITKSGL